MLYVSRNHNQRLLLLNGATQKQVYKFRYLGVAFASDERQNKELGIHIDWAIATMKALHYSAIMRRFSSCETKIVKNEAKLSIFETVFVPSYQLYFCMVMKNSVMIERVQLQVQASKTRFLQKIQRSYIIDKVHIF